MSGSLIMSRTALRHGTSAAALLVAMIASPAFAQTAPVGPTTDQPAAATSATPVAPQAQSAAQGDATAQSASDNTGNDIVVTGSLFRRTDTETPSPVTVISADALQKRGIQTPSEAIQRLSANNAGALPNNFTAGGAFAAGASAVSLRGLTTSSTLVLFDGLRAAYYPLADDGSRNFVDLNTIPDAIIDRIEVLKDGASSTYGADAVAGVVNIITKKQFSGVAGRVEGGISERGDAANQRVSLTAGYGDLDTQGFNVYASGEYRNQEALRSADRGYPYNTANLSKLCLPGGTTLQCRANGIQNGTNADGSYNGLGATPFFVVRPYNAANTTAVPGSRYQLVNPGLGCGTLTPTTLTAAQAASTAGATAALTNCLQDVRNQYNLISPAFEQLGASARATANLGENTQFYAMFNYYQNRTTTQGAPASLRAVTTPARTGVTYSTASLALPVFICASGVNCATAADRQLNPNNPFAAAGQTARVVGRLDYPTRNEYLTKAYRFASGINGSFLNDFRYSLEGTYMRETLRAKYNGYIFVQNLLNVVNNGTFNFRDQSQNSQAVRDYVTPEKINNNSSEVWQVQGNIAKSLFDLPGGPLQVGIGAAYRHESVFAPSANPDTAAGPTARYFTINPFGSQGTRNVKSAYFEIQAPVFDQLEVNGSGRYDDYSSGQNNFSPKIGAKFTPIRQLAIRGTYSRGFRIPSFAEAGADPTTGFITVTPPASYCNAAPVRTGYACDPYSLGLTSVGTPGLKPEKSRNFTGGAIFEPLNWLSFSADYYNIKKTNLIAGANYAPAIAAYYANTTAPGLTTIADAADPQNPNYKPRLGFIQYGFANANSLKTSGLDFTAEARAPLGNGIKLVSSLEASFVIKYTTAFSDGSPTQRYDGTLGPYQITSASGTPKWKGSWQNTIDFDGAGSLTATAYYTSGYGAEAEDAGGTRGDCLSGIGGSTTVYRDGVTPVLCDVKRFISVDMNGAINVAENFSVYLNVYNIFDAKAPYDPNTYGGYQYNPAWASAGILGRSFSAGARFKF